MDQINRRLLKALELNPRLTCTGLSKILGISVSSVQKRISALEESRCILGYHAWVSLEALGGVRAVVHGQMPSFLDSDMLMEIEKNGSITMVLVGSHNHLYLWANLRDISDLEGVLWTAQTICHVSEPGALIIGQESRITISSFPDKKDRPPIEALTVIDYRIICSLHNDARKPIYKLADELGISAKTVRKHLSRLIENDLIEFYISQDPQQRGELFFIVWIILRSMDNRKEAVVRLKRDQSSFVGNILTFSNRPDLVAIELITRSVADLRDKLAELQGYPGVESITWDLYNQRHQIKTWRDKMLDDLLRDLMKKGSQA
jgi:DNA-binding Lrp family transcriptional regulator